MTNAAGGLVIAELVGEARKDKELVAAVAGRHTHPRLQLAVATLTRAQQRGQIRAEVDPEVLVDQLWGGCYHRVLLPDQPLILPFATP